jgi:acetyl-CoA C-acetyltransferase
MMSAGDGAVAVLGAGLSKFALARPDGTPVEWMVEAAQAAIADAGADPQAIEHSIVSYESEILARQLTMGQVVQDALGLCPKPSVRVEPAEEQRVACVPRSPTCAGPVRFVLVVGAGRGATGSTGDSPAGLCAVGRCRVRDGSRFFRRTTLMMQEHMRLTAHENARAGVVKNHRNALSNPMACTDDGDGGRGDSSPPVASPWRLDCAVLADGAAALVLATPGWAAAHARAWRDRPRVFMTGTGCGTERMRLGDRPQPYPGIAHFRAKREAAAMAYRMAGIRNPRAEIDVAEVADNLTGVELQSCEDLGFCGYGESGPLCEQGVFDLDGELPTNTSGGLIGQGAPPGAMGLAQVAEILAQLRGECPKERQVPGARRGLTDIHGGTASLSVVCVFERRD